MISLGSSNKGFRYKGLLCLEIFLSLLMSLICEKQGHIRRNIQNIVTDIGQYIVNACMIQYCIRYRVDYRIQCNYMYV